MALSLLSSVAANGETLVRPRLPQDDLLLDLILRTTDDPDVLTARQSALRQKLIEAGVDPRGERRRITLQTLLEHQFNSRAGYEPSAPARQQDVVEADWPAGLVHRFRYPMSHLFFTDVDSNRVGIAFKQARDMADSSLSVDLTSVDAWIRSASAIGLRSQWRTQLKNRQSSQDQRRDLLNFTLPIRLPRTLERIIGRGDATNIRISGQETISISGESTVRDDSFLGNEINQSRSLFPSLEMKQSLRVSLDGQVGEKIKVTVTHDSEAIGTESTEVKLAFEGDEDDIIQVIRAGNIDVTLPGSRLLGVRASQGGLFGIKIEGAVGRLEYVLVTSKEQSQQNRATFNQSGGSAQEFRISSVDYIRNKFFRLTAPVPFFFRDENLADQSGLWLTPVEQGGLGYRIDPDTVELYRSDRSGGTFDENTVGWGIAFVDRTGRGFGAENNPDGVPAVGTPGLASERWRRLERNSDWDVLVQGDGTIIGFELLTNIDDRLDILACSYNIVDANGVIVKQVGRAAFDSDPQIPNQYSLGAEDQEVYFFKMLKPRDQEAPFAPPDRVEGEFDITWEYMFRNFYDLKGSDIDQGTFQMRIERSLQALENPEFDTENGNSGPLGFIPWIQTFGLDQLDLTGAQNSEPDGQPDVFDQVLFNLQRGYVQFPSPTPFDMTQAELDFFSGINGYAFRVDPTPMVEADDDLPLNTPTLYRNVLTSQQQTDLRRFELVATHTSTSSRFRLNAFNIKQDSEEVTLNGQILTRGTDYDIDYFSGEINLTGAANRLNAQSNINITYEVDPLFGGGRTSLHGIYLGYDLGLRKSITTTWLLQSKPNPSKKPRLGEEPSRNWVGNVATKLAFSPGLLRRMVNLLPLVDSEDPANVNLDAELAVSVPNPNTLGDAYLEDFEAADESITIPMSRDGWFWSSIPAIYEEGTSDRAFTPAERAYAGWHRPVPGVKREELNPDLSAQERRDVLPSLELRVESGDPVQWQQGEFAGIIRGFGGELDLSESQFLEFWVNDFTGDGNDLLAAREGVIHFDFGNINEDFWWPRTDDIDAVDGYELRTWQREDRDNDNRLGSPQDPETGLFTTEDTGLDGLIDAAEGDPQFPQRPRLGNDRAGDNFDSEEEPFPGAAQFLYINGTELNQKLDSEDLNRNGVLDLSDGYFTLEFKLDDMDVVQQFVQGDSLRSYRKVRLDMRKAVAVSAQTGDSYGYRSANPDLSRVRYFRMWYENPDGIQRARERRFIFTEMRFLGSRWIDDELRDLNDNILMRTASEDFSVGVLNNKDDQDVYVPAVFPDTRNNVAAKEQALQLIYNDLQPGHQIRVRRQVPGQGQDFSVYGELNFFWRAPPDGGRCGPDDVPCALDLEQQQLEPFYWVGSDSNNYYEISFPFSEMDLSSALWQECRVDLGEMTNVKVNGVEEPLSPGSGVLVRRGDVVDRLTGEIYNITVRGRPDLRRVTTYYAGVRNPFGVTSGGVPVGRPVTGEVLFNEIRLKEVDRNTGFAKRVAMNANVPGFGDFGVDWSETDGAFRGLNQPVGSRALRRDWNARASSSLEHFVPLFGLEVPFSLSTRRSKTLPDFLTQSDVELLTDLDRDNEKSEDKSDTFNFQVRKRPGENKWLQYTLDRLSYSLSGTRSTRDTPRLMENQRSANTKVNYDVRLGRGATVKIPFTKTTIRYLPNQLTLGTNWQYNFTERTDRISTSSGFEDRVQPAQEVRTNNNTMTLSYNPVQNIRTSYSSTSNRDIQTQREDRLRLLGLDWGSEKRFSERVSVNYTPDIGLIKWLEPDVTYSATYSEDRQPRRQSYAGLFDEDGLEPIEIDGVQDGFVGIEGDVRHVSNSNDLSLRGKINLVGWLKRWSDNRARNQPPPTTRPVTPPGRARPRGVVPPVVAPTDTTSTAELEDLAQGEEEDDASFQLRVRQQLRERALQARERSADEPGGGVVLPDALAQDQDPAEQAEDERGRDEEEDGEADDSADGEVDSEAGEVEEPEPTLDVGAALLGVVKPFWNMVVNLKPISGTYQVQNRSGYQHVRGRSGWLYRLGVSKDFDAEPVILRFDDPDDLNGDGDLEPVFQDFSTSNLQKTERLNLSTQTDLSDDMRLDLTFAATRGNRGGTQANSRDYSTEWPSATLRVSRVHEWGIFGDMFSSSTIDVNYRRTRSANGVTAQTENPKTAVQIGPRWTFRLQNGLDANVSVRWNRDISETPVNELRQGRFSTTLGVQKNFDADGFLSFLRFGKKGTGTTIDMRVDATYDRSSRERFTFATNTRPEFTDQQSGRTSLRVAPNFSYQFSRNLRAGLQLNFNRSKDIANDQVTTSFGLGFNATLTF